MSTRWWLLVDHCVLRNWDRILVRAVKGIISRAGMVSICPLLWQRDVKLQQTNRTGKTIYLAPGGGCEVLFSPGLSVCLSVCVSVCVCVRPIFWYFISQLLEEISIWNLCRIFIGWYSIHRKNIDLHRSMVKVTGTVHCFLKVQSYHKNWAIEKFHFFLIDTY